MSHLQYNNNVISIKQHDEAIKQNTKLDTLGLN